jgi:hypothetical protein
MIMGKGESDGALVILLVINTKLNHDDVDKIMVELGWMPRFA